MQFILLMALLLLLSMWQHDMFIFFSFSCRFFVAWKSVFFLSLYIYIDINNLALRSPLCFSTKYREWTSGSQPIIWSPVHEETLKKERKTDQKLDNSISEALANIVPPNFAAKANIRIRVSRKFLFLFLFFSLISILEWYIYIHIFLIKRINIFFYLNWIRV